MLVFVEGGTLENTEKNPQSKLEPTYDLGPESNLSHILVKGKHSYLAPRKVCCFYKFGMTPSNIPFVNGRNSIEI